MVLLNTSLWLTWHTSEEQNKEAFWPFFCAGYNPADTAP